MKKFILTPEQLEIVLMEEETLEGFEDFSFYTDTDKGNFNAEKGAMTDYPIHAINQKTKEKFQGRGGYYTAVTGNVFDDDVEFKLVVKKKKEVFYLLTFDQAWEDVRVFASKCFSEKEFEEWKSQSVNMHTTLNINGFEDEYNKYLTNAELIDQGLVEVKPVTKSFHVMYTMTSLNNIRTCNVFEISKPLKIVRNENHNKTI